MSDNSIESYDGLDAAAPSLSAPAFGDVAVGGAAPPPPPPPDNTGIVPVPIRPACSNANCGNPTEHPAEKDWQQLMSAVPVERQLYRLRPKEAGMAFPTEADFRAAVAAVRPEYADAHSLEHLRNAWNDNVTGKLADWSERLKSNLNDLAEGWSGTDFEAFESACTQTRELVDDLIDDIDATVANLQSTEESLYSIQGGDSGEIPYPAPQFWIDGDWHSWVSVHVRPAWWHGDCIEYTCQDAEHVLALGGAEPELATEIIDYIDERILHYIDYYASPVNIERDGLDPSKGLTVVEAKELAVADAMEHYGTLVESSWGAYDSRQSASNEDIQQRSTDTDAEDRSVRTVRSDKEYPATADPAYMNLEPPPMEQPAATAQPMASEDPSLDPPAGETPEPDQPAPEPDPDEEDPSGGLASGGSGVGGGGGFGGGSVPSTAATGSGASFGSSMGGAALGATAAGAAAAAQAGPRSSTAMMGGGGGMAGGRGMGAEDKDREPDVDLVEDENMWGYVNEDDDPYA
ncbi:WXG100 family type VII secretion target [Glycomyces sp. NPDC048151]|uniref:WXG100 family type VII secretion target n=1 Tax=Glycomyces sp. NPDC048151 TaxID=3364002 RepID=UPI003723A695